MTQSLGSGASVTADKFFKLLVPVSSIVNANHDHCCLTGLLGGLNKMLQAMYSEQCLAHR